MRHRLPLPPTAQIAVVPVAAQPVRGHFSTFPPPVDKLSVTYTLVESTAMPNPFWCAVVPSRMGWQRPFAHVPPRQLGPHGPQLPGSVLSECGHGPGVVFHGL